LQVNGHPTILEMIFDVFGAEKSGLKNHLEKVSWNLWFKTKFQIIMMSLFKFD